MSILELASCGFGIETRKLSTLSLIFKKQIVSIAFNSPASLSFLNTARPIFWDNLSPVIGLSLDFILDSSEDWDCDESLSDVLMDIPTETSDNLKQWMTKVMKFFMSYKLQILDTQSVNKLDLEVNRLKDGLTFNSMHEFTDYMNATDSSSIVGTHNLKPDKMRPKDLVEVIEYYEEVEDE